MTSPLPEDPYISLGVPKDASAQTIKTQYRKLVLKFHPDKVQDETQKQAAVDQFHKIQKAYEVVGDEDRRARYDAQCKLAALKKDAMMRERPDSAKSDVRSAANRTPPDDRASYFSRRPARDERAPPRYEERRPSYAASSPYVGGDDFDAPRPTSRKDTGYERSTKRPSSRASQREDRELKGRAAGREAERAKNREREARRDREIRRDRQRKSVLVEEDTESDSDETVRDRRWDRDHEQRRAARASYSAQAKRDKEDALRGYYDSEDRARKFYSQYDDAREYMDRAGRSRRQSYEDERPAPARMASTKDKVEYIKRGDGRPSVMVRRGSGRPTGSSREDERRASERPTSTDSARTKPPLTKAQSSPTDIKLPFEKQRAQTAQTSPEKEGFVPPRMKRAETMPSVQTARGETRRKEQPQKASGLRQTETVDGMVSPGPTPGPSPTKYTYRQEYADDTEYPTPDGYRTELREPPPQKSRYTRSPSPMHEAERSSKARAASSRYPTASPQPVSRPAPTRTTSTSYVYSGAGHGVEAAAYARPPPRPAMPSRENSRTESSLYAELPRSSRDRDSASSPRQMRSKYSPPPESVRYGKDVRPEDIKFQSGYGSRRPSAATRPSYTRQSSYATAR